MASVTNDETNPAPQQELTHIIAEQLAGMRIEIRELRLELDRRSMHQNGEVKRLDRKIETLDHTCDQRVQKSAISIKEFVVDTFQGVLKALRIVDSQFREKILEDLVDRAARLEAEDKKGEVGDVASVLIKMGLEENGEF